MPSSHNYLRRESRKNPLSYAFTGKSIEECLVNKDVHAMVYAIIKFITDSRHRLRDVEKMTHYLGERIVNDPEAVVFLGKVSVILNRYPEYKNVCLELIKQKRVEHAYHRQKAEEEYQRLVEKEKRV